MPIKSGLVRRKKRLQIVYDITYNLGFGEIIDCYHRSNSTTVAFRLNLVEKSADASNFFCYIAHIRNTPNRGASSTGAFSAAANASPNTSRVCAGSIIPSSHSRAVA